MFSFQCPFRFRTSNLFLQPVWCRELVVTTRATHCNPQCQRITPDLLFCRASGGRSGYRHGDRNRCLAVVATSSVHVNRLNAGAIGGCAVSHAGTAKIAGLAVQEGLREVVVLERLHGPGGAVMGSGIGRLKRSDDLQAHHLCCDDFDPSHKQRKLASLPIHSCRGNIINAHVSLVEHIPVTMH
jgi:hypothetical protein